MKIRDVVIYTGQQFKVPQGIQRIDHRATHGWQLRYGGTRLFSDGQWNGDPAEALAQATKELAARIASLPAPTRLQREPSQHKSNDLPAGINGPVVRQRKGSSIRTASFAVLVPVFGGKAKRRSVYIGSEANYTIQRYEAALARAIEIRRDAERAYEEAATQAKRQEGRALLGKPAGRGRKSTT